ncbi:MAG: alpha/beta hydrolase [Actinomycetota bacterium]|nr:alpha/beta hydrolase [Actinomycetota bacterium]
MSPAIRLGDTAGPSDAAPPPLSPRLDRKRVTVGDIPTRALTARGSGPPVVLLHGWLDNAETWLPVLERLAARGRAAVAYDQPGFGVAPPMEMEDALGQLTDFAEVAVRTAATKSGRKVVVAGNSLGGWVCLRLAERSDLPLAGIVPIAPAGIRMAQLFFTADRIPIVHRVITMPAPLPPAAVRGIVGRFYRNLAFGDPGAVEQAVIDRFTKFNGDRDVLARRIEYVKRVRGELDRAFDAERIEVPVTVIWGDRDRLCLPAGAGDLAAAIPHARIQLLEGVGHTPQVEAPDVVVDAIAELAGRD